MNIQARVLSIAISIFWLCPSLDNQNNNVDLTYIDHQLPSYDQPNKSEDFSLK